MPCNIPIQVNGHPAWGCDSAEDASRSDYARHKTWRDSVVESAVEFAQGVGDTAESLFYFPEDTLKYITGADAHYGQRNSWSNIGSTLTWPDNPAMRAVVTVNNLVYGGIDLVLGHIPYMVVNEKLGLNMPYFNPPPQTVRGLGSDLSMVATILAAPALKARAYRAFGVEVQPKTVVPPSDIKPPQKLAGCIELVVDEELRLRQLNMDDADAVFELIDRNRKHLSQHGDVTASKYPTLDVLLESIQHPKNPSRLRFGIWVKETLVGSINLTPENNRAEIGYYLGSEFQGRGYIQRAVKRVVQYGFEKFNFEEIHGLVHPDNEPSKAVMLKSGFSLEPEKSKEGMCFSLKR